MPRAYGAALALPVAFAALVLAMTTVNGRSARGPTMLGEREAGVAARTSDRSIAEVWLQWSEPAGLPGAWITEAELDALGFDTAVDVAAEEADEHYRRQLSRRAYVAFELNGPAWEAVLAQRAAEPPGQVPGPSPRAAVGPDFDTYGSRLVPVAVSPEAAPLAQRYPDPRTHLITAAVVRIARFEWVDGSPYLGGLLASIDPRRIQVPAALAAALPVRGPMERPLERGYTVSLMYGSRWEPWVVAIDPGPP